MEKVSQKRLSQEQIGEFYHDLFVTAQVGDFEALCMPYIDRSRPVVVDVGGGCGFFSAALGQRLGLPGRVVDLDPVSIERCLESGVDAVHGDALEPPIRGDESFACFNLILHHLVGSCETATAKLQARALSAWRGKGVSIFVNEYIYDSYAGYLSGQIIYAITSSRILSAIGKAIARVMPSLKANTFGVGVRFRADREWREFFARNGWKVLGVRRGEEEEVTWTRRVLLIRSCRRDSYVLQETIP